MTTPAQHTALPDRLRYVIEANGNPAGKITSDSPGQFEDLESAKAIAAELVQRYNSYPDLVEACRAVCAALGGISNYQHERGLPTEDVNKISRAFFQAQRAIAKAEQSSPREGKE